MLLAPFIRSDFSGLAPRLPLPDASLLSDSGLSFDSFFRFVGERYNQTGLGSSHRSLTVAASPGYTFVH